MKILIYGLNYAPEPTGTGKYTGEMAEWLVARGHTVEVICGLPHYPQWQLQAPYKVGQSIEEVVSGVSLFRAPHFIPSADHLTAGARIRLELSFTFSAARYWGQRFLSRSRPDVMIAVTPPMQIGVYPLLYSGIRGVPWVLHVQDLQVDAALRLQVLRVGMLGRILYAVEAFFLRHATRVSTITQAMGQRLQAKGVDPHRIWLFPNWADISLIRPASRDNAFRAALGVPPDAIVLLYAGNMGAKQGLELVLSAAEYLLGQPELYFVLVGDGGARAALVRSAQEKGLTNVRFLPVQPVEQLAPMLAAADIHLVVQRAEAADLVMPSKLTNILAAGRPCIATTTPGTALYAAVADGATGLVCPPGDMDGLVAAIRQLALDHKLRAQMGHNARRYAETYLDKDRILGDFESKLIDLVDSGRLSNS